MADKQSVSTKPTLINHIPMKKNTTPPEKVARLGAFGQVELVDYDSVVECLVNEEKANDVLDSYLDGLKPKHKRTKRIRTRNGKEI